MPITEEDIVILEMTGPSQISHWLKSIQNGDRRDLELLTRWARIYVVDRIVGISRLASIEQIDEQGSRLDAAEDRASDIVAVLFERIGEVKPSLTEWIDNLISRESCEEKFVQVEDRWLEGDYSDEYGSPIYIPGYEYQYQELRAAELMEKVRKELENHAGAAASQRDRITLFLELLGNDFEFSERISGFLEAGVFDLARVVDSLTDFSHGGLLGPDGEPLSRDSKERDLIVRDILAVDEDLLRILQIEPGLVRDISPRRFEELVAEILERLGYEVALTKATRDQGYDIFAARQDALGTFFYLVECKRYRPPRKVGVEVVRSLNGTVDLHGAHAGILVTTSFFSAPAQQLTKERAFKIKLHDYLGFRKWLEMV